MSREQRARQHAVECGELANRAFGYRFALRLALERLGLTDAEVDAALELARDRQVSKFLEALPGANKKPDARPGF